jgi:hypothetical protein
VATSGSYNDLTGAAGNSVRNQRKRYYRDQSGGTLHSHGDRYLQPWFVHDRRLRRGALDSFTGPDDDTKLTNALAAVAADTYKRTILLTNRKYTFTTAGRAAFNGLRIQGPGGYSNADKGSIYEASEINLSMTGAWFTTTT